MKKYIIIILLICLLLLSGCTSSYRDCTTDCESICIKEQKVTSQTFLGLFKKNIERGQECKKICYEECKEVLK